MTTNDALTRTLLIIIAVIVLLPALLMAVMMPMMGMWGWGHMDGGMWGTTGGTGMWLGMWLVVLLVIGGIGYFAYTGVRNSAAAGADPAIEELRASYARGDLSDEEFEQRRERLRREE
ncbi:SHOCT domain-containing protein [Natronomonas sp. F2-12]|uniref:SHOCT domain-containing protein n=1 Tax=Natronomonas aquatica TaxID=2841590 RepID=A0A9R1CS60_9EURY|nr:SHOCT domain-containing protein [Natronomonas aquatica]MCQ4334219.1 SHOCT domain-containing protein [Natronomonas aquatica]